MDRQTFFDNFAHIAEAPNGVKKLRELILQMAVQGKLVPQDSSDEPAVKLLERIKIERKKLIQEKIISEPKSFPVIRDDEIPFAAPFGWKWMRLVDLVTLEYGKSLPAPKRKQSGGIPVYGSNGVVGMHDEALLDRPSIIVGRKGSSGALNISRAPCWPTDVTYFVVPASDMNFDYCYLQLKSLNLDELGKGIKPGLNRNEAYPLLVALPPLVEQQRIVAKVDQLMTLCDELESKQQRTRVKLTLLNNAALNRLTCACAAHDFTVAWHLLRDNFDLLYSTPETIAKLRQSILQLAVQGKLVEQDPNDEPASILLAKIKAEKERLVKEKKIRKSDPLPPVTADEAPYGLPNGWEWVRLDTLVTLLGDGIHGTPNYDASGDYYFINGNNLSDGIIEMKGNTKKVSYQEYCKHKKALNQRSILVSINGTIGNVAFYNNENVILGKSACYFNLFEQVEKNYVKNVLNSTYFLEYALSSATGSTIKNVSLKAMREFLMPLPPLAEQLRIVEKVDQIMSLCDKLGDRLTKAQTKAEKLTSAAVQGLLTT